MKTRPRKENRDLDDLLFGFSARSAKLWETMRVPALWFFAALLSISLLIGIVGTHSASQRLALLPVEVQDLLARTNKPTGLTRLDHILAQLQAENKALEVDRTRLETRLAGLERNYGDITASISSTNSSIKKADTRAEVKAETRAETVVPPLAVPAPGTVSLTAAPAARGVPLESKLTDAPETTSSIDPAEPRRLGGVTATSRSQFGVDIASGASLSALRKIWLDSTTKHGAVLAGYEPLVMARESATGTSLHLIAGPFADVSDAAALCAKLRSAGLASCLPSSYDGQSLVLR